jgi:hypothetical protein
MTFLVVYKNIEQKNVFKSVKSHHAFLLVNCQKQAIFEQKKKECK